MISRLSKARRIVAETWPGARMVSAYLLTVSYVLTGEKLGRTAYWLRVGPSAR